MTVGELKEQLTMVSNDRIIILANDAEGNAYSFLDPIFYYGGCKQEKYTGDIVLSEEDEKNSIKVLGLYPI